MFLWGNGLQPSRTQDRNTSLSSSIPPSTNFEDDDVECGTSKEPFGEFNEGDDDMKMVDRNCPAYMIKAKIKGTSGHL